MLELATRSAGHRSCPSGVGRILAGILLTVLVMAITVLAATPAVAATSMETMPLWRIQVRLTTGDTATAGTDGNPALRFNPTTSGVRTLNPPSKSSFDRGRTDTYDLRLLASPSQITMLRVGIAGNDDWCVKKVELFFNGRLGFAKDAVPGGACATIRGGTYLEYSSADLRSNPAWMAYGSPPALPTRMSAADVRALVTDVTGSAMLSSPNVRWNPAEALTVTRVTSNSVRISFGVTIIDPSGIDSSFTAKVTYDVRLYVGSDGLLHALKANASCCYHHEMSDAVVAQLDTALSRMTALPPPHGPLQFGIDAATNITWSYAPAAAG